MIQRTVGQLEDGPEWPRIVVRLESVPLHDVAREFGITPGTLAAAMVRSRTARKAVVSRGTQPAVGAHPAAPAAPVPAAAPPPEFFPPEPTATARSTGKLDAHLAAYRSAVEGGIGRALLAQLHQLVRVNLRYRIAGTGDADLLARFDADLPPRPAEPGSTMSRPSASTSSTRPLRRPDAQPVPVAAPAPVVEAREAPPQAFLDVVPTQAPSSRVYIVTLLLDGVEQQYGVVAESMGAAVAIAVRATGNGVIVAAARGLPALVG